MSFVSKGRFLERIRRDKESRDRLVSSNVDKGIAFQIRATRDKRGWTQGDLAKATGMSPNNVSRIESEDYGKQTITSLKRIASSLDVALVVRLVPFNQYIDWLSGTPHLDKGISTEAMAVPSFSDEEKSGVFEANHQYWKTFITPSLSNQQSDVSANVVVGAGTTVSPLTIQLPKISANTRIYLGGYIGKGQVA
jgi:transcriptional regulator with XRE-family HTH domain